MIDLIEYFPLVRLRTNEIDRQRFSSSSFLFYFSSTSFLFLLLACVCIWLPVGPSVRHWHSHSSPKLRFLNWRTRRYSIEDVWGKTFTSWWWVSITTFVATIKNYLDNTNATDNDGNNDDVTEARQTIRFIPWIDWRRLLLVNESFPSGEIVFISLFQSDLFWINQRSFCFTVWTQFLVSGGFRRSRRRFRFLSSNKCLQRTVESLRRCPKCQLALQTSDIFPNYTCKIFGPVRRRSSLARRSI